jgi:hypothetical protein
MTPTVILRYLRHLRAAPMTWALALALAWGLTIALDAPAVAQRPPSGQPVLNQSISAALLTKSDSTVFAQTRGLYIGDAAACNLGLKFVNDSAAVTFANAQPGATYPFSVKQLMSANTTCTAVIALY